MPKEVKFDLPVLISGYIREKEKEWILYMNIPDGIGQIIHKLYPLLMFKFGDLKKNLFTLNEDRTILKQNVNKYQDEDDCNGYLVYADLGQFDSIGFIEGIHSWSIKAISGCVDACFCSVGVTTMKNDKLINEWSHDGESHVDWIEEGCNSWFEPHKWPKDVTVTMKLDCNDWTVTYYQDKKQVAKENVEPNKPYFLALLSCGVYGHFSIVES